jgi:hypothetical protein
MMRRRSDEEATFEVTFAEMAPTTCRVLYDA